MLRLQHGLVVGSVMEVSDEVEVEANFQFVAPA